MCPGYVYTMCLLWWLLFLDPFSVYTCTVLSGLLLTYLVTEYEEHTWLHSLWQIIFHSLDTAMVLVAFTTVAQQKFLPLHS